jgi:hypothetical protein
MVLGFFQSNYPDIKEKILYFMAWHDAFIGPKAQSLANGGGVAVHRGMTLNATFFVDVTVFIFIVSSVCGFISGGCLFLLRALDKMI